MYLCGKHRGRIKADIWAACSLCTSDGQYNFDQLAGMVILTYHTDDLHRPRFSIRPTGAYLHVYRRSNVFPTSRFAVRVYLVEIGGMFNSLAPSPCHHRKPVELKRDNMPRARKFMKHAYYRDLSYDRNADTT